jgi:outer membrane protein OmpA-like peptidoglycan-associated protein
MASATSIVGGSFDADRSDSVHALPNRAGPLQSLNSAHDADPITAFEIKANAVEQPSVRRGYLLAPMRTGSLKEMRVRAVAARSGLLTLATVVLGCALVEPPTAQLAEARAAIADAEAAGAAARAPSELAAARERFVQAEARVSRGHHDEAELLADQAAADARLATMTARAAAAETALGLIRNEPPVATDTKGATSARMEGTDEEVLAAAANDARIRRYASAELESAQEAFVEARRHRQRGTDAEVVSYWSYLGRRRAETAREAAKLRQAEEAIQLVRAERQQQRTEPRRTENQPLAAGREVPSESRGMTWAHAAEGVVIVVLSDNQFQEGVAEVDPRAGPNLDRIAELLREDPRRVVRLESHSDDRGSRGRSIDFSGRRAEAIRTALVERGIDVRRIRIRVLGDSYPVASNDTPLGRERNRRIEAVVTSPEPLSGAQN